MNFLLKNFLEQFINLLLFGNFWIAFCAVAMTWQTELLLFGAVEWNYLTNFVFFSTLFLYAIHRIVGLVKVKPFLEKYRYSIIYHFRNHIKFYAFLGAIGALYFFFQLCLTNQLLLVIPIILSLGYVLPFVKGKKRLRDFDYVKIFLIAIVWGTITVLIPILERTSTLEISHILILVERMFFIFAITLPFDIRDLKIDEHIDVKTIPGRIGISKTKYLATFSLIVVLVLAVMNWHLGVYPIQVIIGLSISVATTFILINYSDKTDADYFFTGLMDGTMILQFVLVFFLST